MQEVLMMQLKHLESIGDFLFVLDVIMMFFKCFLIHMLILDMFLARKVLFHSLMSVTSNSWPEYCFHLSAVVVRAEDLPALSIICMLKMMLYC